MADTGRNPRVTDADLLAVFDDTDDPVLSTAEVADRLPIKRRGTLDRLRRLEDRGDVASKPIGGRNTVWWRVAAADVEHVDAGEDIAADGSSPSRTAPVESAAPAAAPQEDDERGDDAPDDLLDGVKFPYNNDREREVRTAAIRRAYALVRERGEIQSREIQETVWEEFKDEQIGYSASESGRGPGYTLWNSCVSDALRDLPGIKGPGQNGTWWVEE